ncbi:MAG: transglutaminase domain-containing protein [Deltaproteobacteria bacterium]|nr:transglutaminase domain-containing protein [Deltaproteobacteria bacterium]
MTRKTILAVSLLLLIFSTSYAKEREGEVTFEVNIEAPENSKDVRVWLPYPLSDNEQTISNIKVEGNFTRSDVYNQKQFPTDKALYAEWTKPTKTRFITLTFKVKAMERIRKDFPSKESQIPAEIKEYLKGSKFIPTDGRIKEIALDITKGKDNIIEKAEAVYDWVIENTFRDPNVQGCGIGSVERMLAEKGGKCADISGVFVALANAAGVPAREIWGLRLGKKQVEDMTAGHHCWAEFYLPGYGWIPVDPADVRKAMLVEKLELNNEKTKKYRDYYFGAVDEYRIVLSRGAKGYNLNPPQKSGAIPYGFMYPYAEIDGKPVEWLAGQKELKYKITFKSE